MTRKAKRDDMHRCRYCGVLRPDSEYGTDEANGALVCPFGCEAPFDQPPYESPFNNDSSAS